jgi:hypothetical protein
MSESQSESVMIKVVLPREIRDKFKGLCALNGKNMNQVLSDFIDNYIEREGKILIVDKDSQPS